MKRRSKLSIDRPHRRFASWLVAEPSGDPPPPLAVHAANCPECQRIVAAMDELAAVDLGLAGIPEPPATPGRWEWLILTRRAALAGASVAAFAAVAFIGWRFFLAPEATLLGAGSLPSPSQAVLGGVDSPQPSALPSAEVSPVPGSPGTSPTGGPDPTAPPSPSLGPPTPGQTPLPSVQPTSAPVANVPPATTPQPTSVANPSAPPSRPPTPPPTPRATPPPPPPTPQPTPPPPPPTPEPTPGGPLAECADLQDNDGDGFIDLLDVDCLDVFDLSESG